MRDRYQKEQDLPLAERWLENYLLTRKQADSRQLLHTTRLTDLIYQGFAAQQPINRFSSDRNTPDMESLAKDLFAALYSPILRRKDEDSVKLKERMLSKPLFEKIVGSGYFNELKGLPFRANRDKTHSYSFTGFCVGWIVPSLCNSTRFKVKIRVGVSKLV